MKTLVLLLCSFVVASCAKSTLPPPPKERAQVPIRVRWEPLELAVDHARLIAHIQRLTPFPAPLAVRIELPNGAGMRVGRTVFELPANREADEHSESVEVTYSQLPAQDLILKVAGTGQGQGVSFEVPYRFGRQDPAGPSVKATGPELYLNGKNLGPSVPLGSQ